MLLRRLPLLHLAHPDVVYCTSITTAVAAASVAASISPTSVTPSVAALPPSGARCDVHDELCASRYQHIDHRVRHNSEHQQCRRN